MSDSISRMEEILKQYFQAWLDTDISIINETFADNVVYSECYGPEYHGLSQIIRWFEEWNQHGRVLEWTIKRIIGHNKTLVAEWYFKCVYDGNVDGFDGVTIADFDNENRIIKLCEFQSRPEHYFPYGK